MALREETAEVGRNFVKHVAFHLAARTIPMGSTFTRNPGVPELFPSL